MTGLDVATRQLVVTSGHDMAISEASDMSLSYQYPNITFARFVTDYFGDISIPSRRPAFSRNLILS